MFCARGLAPFQKEGPLIKATFQPPANIDVALWIINHRPDGLTEVELSEAMFGERNQPRVHQECDLLESKGLIERRRTVTPMRLYPLKA